MIASKWSFKVSVGTWRNPGAASPCTRSSLPLPLPCRRISAWHYRQAPAAQAWSVITNTETEASSWIYWANFGAWVPEIIQERVLFWQIIPEDLHGRHPLRWVQISELEWPWGCSLRFAGTISRFLAPIQQAKCARHILSVHQQECNIILA